MPSRQPWHLGPVPHTDPDAIIDCFVAFSKVVGAENVLCVHNYEIMTKGAGAVDADSIIALSVLLIAFGNVQPDLRFKPTVMRSVILQVIRKFPSCKLDTKGWPIDSFAKVHSARYLTVLYHWRRILHSKLAFDQASDQLSTVQKIKFADVVARGRGEEPARALKRNESEMSAKSCISGGSDIEAFLQEQKRAISSDDDHPLSKRRRIDPDTGEEEGEESEKVEERPDESAEESPDKNDDDGDDSALKFFSSASGSRDKPDRISHDALSASKTNIAPGGRGQQNKLIKKKPAKETAPIADSPGPLGLIKCLLCTHKSYILSFNVETGKWPLVCEVVEKRRADHKAVITALFSMLKKQALTKEEAVAVRNDLVDNMPMSEGPVGPDESPDESPDGTDIESDHWWE